MMQRLESNLFVRARPSQTSQAAILYVHGLGESGLCFESLLQAPTLSGFAQLAPDLPGYGRSLWPKAPGDFALLVDTLAEWLYARECDAVTVVGHSLGGVLALLLAEKYPKLVRAVVDVDGNKSFGDCTFSAKALDYSEQSFCEAGFPTLLDQVYRAGIEDQAQRGYYASMRHCQPLSFYQHSLELVELSRSETLALRLAALPIPKLYIAGSPGGACPRSLELLDQAKVPTVCIGPSGHWPFLDQPAAFTKTLVEFLTGL